MTKMREVAIVIPANNASKTIGKAIEACLGQDYPKDKIRIIIVDDGSTDNTKEIVKNYPVDYISQEKAGPSKARNTGWRSARSEIIAFLDAECVPERKWISKMVRYYESDDTVCVGGRYGIANEGNFLAELIYGEFLARYTRCSKSTQFIGSYGYSFCRSVLEEIGGYNEEFTMASAEDNDLAYRLLAGNYSLVFDTDIVIKHHFATKLHRYLKAQFWHGCWRMKLYRIHIRMIKGDEYSNVMDFAQPPLMLLFVCVLPFMLLNPFLIIIEILFLSLVILLQMPIALHMLLENTNGVKHFIAYILLGLVRAIIRGFGMVAGILRFWVIGKT